ncbi:YehS family protein [Marinobacterium arenosum]|uniref:DUF1456 family protein n=1 Tax=Marinobacterium arenosum TaxID=2862496 RepID=UPI001C987199|nr:DUF1456 family protein [Marinobacterium arenosum]MBY4675169.1 DUF1456 family protein [Marinobacterium arenosum]
MITNEILRRLTSTLELGEEQMLALFQLGGCELAADELQRMLLKDHEPDFLKCWDERLVAFLDGLITERRGPRDTNAPAPQIVKLTNNAVLKKIRIALDLQEPAMLQAFQQGGVELSRPELRALFRNEQHKHYKACSDQMLRALLVGLEAQLQAPS